MKAMTAQQQLQWLGHVIRMQPNWLPLRVLYGQLYHGQCPAGGQRKRHKDQVKVALRKCKIRPEDLDVAAANRNNLASAVTGWVPNAKGGNDSQETAKETQEEYTHGRSHHYHHKYMIHLQ